MRIRQTDTTSRDTDIQQRSDHDGEKRQAALTQVTWRWFQVGQGQTYHDSMMTSSRYCQVDKDC